MEVICGVCKQPILEEKMRVAYEGKGINPNSPKTWVPLCNSLVKPTNFCALIYDIEYNKNIGFLTLSMKEYQEAIRHRIIPKRYKKYIFQNSSLYRKPQNSSYST